MSEYFLLNKEHIERMAKAYPNHIDIADLLGHIDAFEAKYAKLEEAYNKLFENNTELTKQIVKATEALYDISQIDMYTQAIAATEIADKTLKELMESN